MKVINARKCTGLLGMTLAGLMAGNVMAQDPVTATLSEHTDVAADGAVEVTLAFQGNGESASFQGDFVYDDSNVTVDLTDCAVEMVIAGITGSCEHPAGDTSRIRILMTIDPAPLPDIELPIAFELDGTLADGSEIPLAWNEDSIPLQAEDPAAEANGTDGLIVIGGGGDCTLSIDPASHDYGTLDLNEVASQSFTIANEGTAACTDLAVTVDGAEFSLDGNDCADTLDPDASCTADVSFSSATEGDFTGNLNADAAEGNASAGLSGAAEDGPPPPPATAIPTMQGWGLAVMALLMLAVGAIGVRTFRS